MKMNKRPAVEIDGSVLHGILYEANEESPDTFLEVD